MTVCGFAVTVGGARAVAWADSEFYLGSRPAGHASKVEVNAALHAVVTGCGVQSLLHSAKGVLAKCTDFDALPGLTAKVLRRKLAVLADECPADQPWDTTVALVGWSHSARQFRGYLLAGSSFFEPTPARRWQSPSTPGVAGEIDGDHAVMAVVAAQLAELRKGMCVDDGVVVLAEMTPAAITLRPLVDVATGAFLNRPWRPAAPPAAA